MFWKRLLLIVGIVIFLVLPGVDTPWNSMTAVESQALGLIDRHFYFSLFCWFGVGVYVLGLIISYVCPLDYLQKEKA